LNKGTYEGVEIFSSNSYKMLTTKQYTISTREDIGLSWFLSSSKSKGGTVKRIEHTGRDVGYNTWFLIIPETSFAFVFLENGDFTSNYFSIMTAAYEIAYKYE